MPRGLLLFQNEATGMMITPRLIRIAAIAAASGALLVASSAGGQDNSTAAGPATAEATTYGPPPPLPNAAEVARLRDGMAAADRSDWYGLQSLRDSASDPLVRRMLQWRLATSTDAPSAFSDLRGALEELQGWPGRNGMRERAEQAIMDTRLSAAERIAFLRQENGPISGDGRLALAIALRDEGQRSEAVELARRVWREDALTSVAEDRALSEFSSEFSSEDHAARVDGLLWRGQRTAAQRLMPRLNSADRALAAARIAMQSRARRGLQTAVDAVPASRADDPGFLYDRVQYRRRTGSPEEALPLAARIDARQAPLAARDEIYDERRLFVPRAMRARNYRLAYELVSNHGLTSGEEFADAEWLSGWLQLRFLDNPQRAAEHFAHLDQRVSSPVSSSRAIYWRAQAAEAMGQRAEAQELYARAARFPFTYYGQLAATHGDNRAMMTLPATDRISEQARNRFGNRELVRALRLVAQVGDQRDYESIAFYLDDTLDDPQEIELLSLMGREQSYYRTALRNAKAGLFRNVVAPNAAYPLITLPGAVNRPEPALVLAIIRQESEFDARAVSHANAHGLMQLIPSTAQLQARRVGMTYQRAALTSDPEYNMTLGASHLADLVDDFNGSYVLAIASYNAGASRAREWIGDYGDPRSRSVDVVDWVELIPFSETRNYVQRVMENLQVYRYRLADGPTPIELESDLRRGGY
jgi:soluble lytic murein transglycosylase